jgi:hypothetical protein
VSPFLDARALRVCCGRRGLRIRRRSSASRRQERCVRAPAREEEALRASDSRVRCRSRLSGRAAAVVALGGRLGKPKALLRPVSELGGDGLRNQSGDPVAVRPVGASRIVSRGAIFDSSIVEAA